MEIECAYATNIQYCSVIRFLMLRNVMPNKIHRCLTATYGSEVMSVQAVRKWCHEFNNRWTRVFDKERAGQSVSVSTDELRKKIDATI